VNFKLSIELDKIERKKHQNRQKQRTEIKNINKRNNKVTELPVRMSGMCTLSTKQVVDLNVTTSN
jgi:hypothetical protein